MSRAHSQGSQPAPVLWLQDADGGCASCASESTQEGCPTSFDAPRCEQPELDGEEPVLARLLNALRQVGDRQHGHNIVDDRHIRSLRVTADEAELVLTFQSACGIHQHLADAAFQVLRRELPDTDIYIVHQRQG